MYSSLEVANFFIKSSLNTGEQLTPMKLIKLCYISHGWHLGFYDEELIDEAIQAWKYGPVIESLYHRFKGYGNSQIKEVYQIEGEYPIISGDRTQGFLEQVWNAYKGYTGVELSSLTHQEGTPWDIVWNRQGGSRDKSVIIGNDIIKDYYKNIISQSETLPIINDGK